MRLDQAARICQEHGITHEIRQGKLMAQTLAFSDEWSEVPHGTPHELYVWLGY